MLVAVAIAAPFPIVRIRPISVPLMRPVAVLAFARRHGAAAAGIVAETLAVAADADVSVDAAGTDFYTGIRHRDAGARRRHAGARRRPMVAILGLRRRHDAAEQDGRRDGEYGKSKRSESPHPHLLSLPSLSPSKHRGRPFAPGRPRSRVARLGRRSTGGAAALDISGSLGPSQASVDVAGEVLHSQVEILRRRGVSWAAIGEALGISRQAAWERFS